MNVLTVIQKMPFRILQGMTQLNPGAVDLVKLLAMLAMLLDHFNTLFLNPLRPELYALGRAAFPLFSLIWAINVNRKPERLQFQANRLWLWAVATQPVFILAFHQHDPWYALNILFVFAGATQLLAWHRQYGTRGGIAGTVLLAVLAWPLTPASYGLQGEIMTVGLAVFAGRAPRRYRYFAAWGVFVALVILNGASHLPTMPVATLVFAVLPTLLFPWMVVTASQQLMADKRRRWLPARFFYPVYAGHLLLAGTIGYFV
ncbi:MULTISPECIES: TraX family protein [Cronobacter]|uniref:TraX family protein n=1 Tax=Cronobacter TaxID=413496 RepID=UPI0030B825FD